MPSGIEESLAPAHGENQSSQATVNMPKAEFNFLSKGPATTTQSLVSPYQHSAFHAEFAVLGSFGRKGVNAYGLIERVLKETGTEEKILWS